MRHEIIASTAALARLREAWDALLARSAQPQITRSSTWNIAWWHVYGSLEGRRLCSVAIYDDDALVGFAPLVSRGRWGIRRVELMGSGENQRHETCGEYIGVIAERGREQVVADELVRALASEAMDPWDELAFVNLSSEDDVVPLLADALERLGDVDLSLEGVAPWIALPTSWPEYLSERRAAERTRLERALRRFDRWATDGHRLVVAANETERHQGMKVLRHLHAERWALRNQSGAFASCRFRGFHEEVSRQLLAQGALELSWLEVAGRPVAAQYCFVSGDRVQFYQSGRVADGPSKVPVGIVLHLLNIRRAIARGNREYDFLAGATRYKLEMANRLRPLYRMRVTRHSLRGRLYGAGRLSRRWLRERLSRPHQDER
jgi:CelD/BcsL family acetyltransferase involved in cellulose biosynthesis